MVRMRGSWEMRAAVEGGEVEAGVDREDDGGGEMGADV